MFAYGVVFEFESFLAGKPVSFSGQAYVVPLGGSCQIYWNIELLVLPWFKNRCSISFN